MIGSLYRSLGEPVRILWKGSTACNTIHVEDVCRAVWHLSKLPEAAGETYNLVDTGETTQGMIAEIVSSLFGVKHEFLGSVISSLCKVCKFNWYVKVRTLSYQPFNFFLRTIWMLLRLKQMINILYRGPKHVQSPMSITLRCLHLFKKTN